MQRKKIRICVMRVGGTNRDGDVARCLRDLMVNVDIAHVNALLRRRNLGSYDGLVIPGGFAYGDYVRAGAIWGKKLQSSLGSELESFTVEKKPILGICNGFQVLIEAGLLPGRELANSVSLLRNKSGRFECRWVRIRKERRTRCIFTKLLSNLVSFPVAHGEGRFAVTSGKVLGQLSKRGQIALRYALETGVPSNGKYPGNPNGSEADVAGICNSEGNVFGLMPHPEDAYFGYQMPLWSMQKDPEKHGDGRGIMQSMVEYIENEF